MGSRSTSLTREPGESRIGGQNMKSVALAVVLLLTIILAHSEVDGVPINLFNPFGRRRPNQGLKQHGRNKFYTGAGLWALGSLTGNSGLQNVGGGLAQLGLASKLAAHFF